tara:strand:+ start:533 stop:754 length:222 start_codon:yes stop_codon:yes gene_type:complete
LKGKCLALLLLLGFGVRAVAAESFTHCPGQQAGVIPGLGKVSAYCSECTSEDEVSAKEYYCGLVINVDNENIE